ncbi:MAG: glycosyltransferase family 2 protein [Candidatus Neomarinimicrobiota bacterium]
MKVSVIVSIYNGEDVLPLTIPALLNQNYPHESTEIILVDDASTDETPSLLENREWKDRATVVRHTENRGRTATRNSGIDTATGDLLVFVDCDIEVGPEFLSLHVEQHRNSGIVGVLSNVRPREMKSSNKYHRYLFSGRRGAKLVGENHPLPFRYFIMTCASIKAYAVRKTGKFNEKLPGYGIDLEYAYRLWNNYPNGLFYSSGIVVFMHKAKDLHETLVDFREYGRRNVPIILSNFPELAPYVGADFVSSPPGSFSLRGLVGSLLINQVMSSLARMLLMLAPYPLSNHFVRYLMLSAAAMGYRESLKSRD